MELNEIIAETYESFNNRAIDHVLAIVSRNVKWANGWEGGFVQGHEGIRDYWTRQWKEMSPYLYPVSIKEEGQGNVQVEVHQIVKDLQGKVIFDGTVKHHFLFEDGLIAEFHLNK